MTARQIETYGRYSNREDPSWSNRCVGVLDALKACPSGGGVGHGSAERADGRAGDRRCGDAVQGYVHRTGTSWRLELDVLRSARREPRQREGQRDLSDQWQYRRVCSGHLHRKPDGQHPALRSDRMDLGLQRR